jgi:23S rRNA (guanosine2251-2'-O)-methyltransferase
MPPAKPPKDTSHQAELLGICGVNPVNEALKGDASVLETLLLARKPDDDRVIAIEREARASRIPVQHLDREALTELLGHGYHQGVARRSRGFPYADADVLLQRSADQLSPLLLLDSIQDPQNLGAILRSGCFLGARGVILPKDRAVAVTSAVIKVAAGAASLLSIARVTNLVRTLEAVKAAGLWVVGLELQSRQSLYDADLTAPVALVVGNEHKGLRPLVREHCDLLLHLPAHGTLQSLNAASAAAIALAEIQRQRAMKNPTRR